MKKLSLIVIALMFFISAKADIFISNFTPCTFVVSIGGGPASGYHIIPPGASIITSSALISGFKLTYWPSYPSVGIISQDNVGYVGSSGTFFACMSVNWIYTPAGGINTNLLIMPS